MKKYTLETLKKENELFDSYYGLDESDVEKVNRIIEMIERSRYGNILNVPGICLDYSKFFQIRSRGCRNSLSACGDS